MATIKSRVSIPWTTVACDSDTVVAVPASQWMETSGISALRAVGEFRNFAGAGTLSVALGIQAANEPDTPIDITATLLITYQTSANLVFPDSDVAFGTTMKAYQMYRFVWYVKLGNSETALTTARVSAVVEVWS